MTTRTSALAVVALLAGVVVLQLAKSKVRKPSQIERPFVIPALHTNVDKAVVSAASQDFRREFTEGSSLVWTAGVGGVVFISNTSPQTSIFSFLRSEAWMASAAPLQFRYVLPPNPEPEQRRVHYSWTADTFDFRRSSPVIDFKDYKR